MPDSLRNLEARVAALESNQVSIQELIGLLEDVKSALRIFVKIGNGVKWLAVIVVSSTSAIIAIKKWL